MIQNSGNKDNKLTFADLGQIIVYGFDNITKRFVYIDDCENGLNCGLVCKFCGNPLNAKNNCAEMRNHFAHKVGSDCRKGHESTIPLLFKKVLDDDKTIKLPIYRYPYDSSLTYEYGTLKVKSVDLEKYEDDLSFNVVVETTNGMTIAFIPYMKSSNVNLRKAIACVHHDYVLAIDFEQFKNSKFVIEYTIKEIIKKGCYKSTFTWVKSKEELMLKEKYDLICKQKEEERKRKLNELLEQRKKPIIIGDETYYYIEGVEALSPQKKRVFIKSAGYQIVYLIDFTGSYKDENGLFKGYRLNDDGVLSDNLEIIKYQENSFWSVH